LVRKWLTQLRKAKDASLDNRLEINRFPVSEYSVESYELFIAGAP
jgi:hypothetical protein